jgi:DnaK suppressor protein
MKTVAKKTVKKVPLKVTAKVKTTVKAKVTAKKVVKPAKAIVKTATKTVAKPVKKPATKSAAKSAAKPVSKPVVKATVKSKAKPATKAVVKKPIKPIAKSAAIAKPVKPVKPAKSVKVAEVAAKKAVKPAKAIEKSKAVSKPPKVESNLKQPMVIASKIAPPETKDLSPAAPTPSKARTSRLASLTVPSMAQSVASTAAKSSYGPQVPSLALIPPPQSAPKHNPKLANNWKTKTAEEMTDAELLAMPDSEYMNIKQMTYFRLKLMQLKQGILASAGATTEHLRDDSAVVPDPTDRATIEEEHALELRTRDRERKLLKKIEQSIVRIDAGDYGYCDETGEAIGVGRLLARPTATLSLEAQQRRELKQKMFGD